MVRSSIPLAILLIGFAVPASADPPFARDQGPRYENLTEVRERLRDLSYEVGRLQDDIIYEIKGPRREQDLYQQADEVHREIHHLQYLALQDNVGQRRLHENFQSMDRKLHALLRDLRNLPGDKPVLDRTAWRVQRADEELHEVITRGNPQLEEARQALRRHANVLIVDAQQLQQMAQYVLANDPRRQAVEASIQNYIQAVERFLKLMPEPFDREQTARLFAPVARNWGQVVQTISALNPRENMYLRLRAQRLDNFTHNMATNLGLPSAGPRLKIGLASSD